MSNVPMITKKDTKEYNGYTNYATWNFSLWLDNEECTCNDLHKLAQDVKNELITMDKARLQLKNDYIINVIVIDDEVRYLYIDIENLQANGIDVNQKYKCALDSAIRDLVRCDKIPITEGMYSDLLSSSIDDIDFTTLTDRVLNGEIIKVDYLELLQKALREIDFDDVISSHMEA